MRSLRSLVIPFALFLAAMTVAVGFQNRMIDRWRKQPSRYRDTLYLPSSDYVKIISLGYNQFVADFLWLRMIQTFAGGWSSAENPSQLMQYCDVISDLDPRFEDPYSFAIMGIGEECRTHAIKARAEGKTTDPFGSEYLSVEQIDAKVQGIVQKAIEKNPGHYKVPYDGAFFAFWNINDPALAKYYVRMAKQDPNYPIFLESWEGYFDSKQGRYRAAYEKFLGDYVKAVAAGNEELFPIALNHLNRAINDWFVDEIRQRVLSWQQEKGQLPTLDELRQAGAFKGVELPDVAAVKGLLQGLLEGTYKPETDDVVLRQIAERLIRPWDDLPPGPYDFIDPRYRGYVIWHAKPPKDDKFILPMLEALRWTKTYVTDATATAKESVAQGGEAPEFDTFFKPVLTEADPFGQPWVYDRKTGELKSATFPELAETEIPSI